MSETEDVIKKITIGSSEDNSLRKEIESLEEEIKILLNQKKSLEYTFNLEREAYKRELSGAYDDLNKQTREKNQLKRQLEEIMKPPMLVGEVIDILERGELIIKNGTGQSFITTRSKNVKPDEIKIGSRVGLDKSNLVVMRILSHGKDPIIMGSELIEKPAVTYDDIGGIDSVITEVKEMVELPLKKPDLFKRIGIKPPNGVLLVGAPGTGKTLIAKAVANSANCTFIRIVGSEMVQKFIGEGGRLVRELFQLAREKKPAIIFIDEIDAIGARRLGMDTTGDREVQRTLMQLLAEMDGFHPLDNIGIIAATNRKDIIDDALLRPGRFDRIIEVPLPNKDGRRKIIDIHTKDMKLARGLDKDRLVQDTDGFSGADLRNLCTEAGMFAIRNNHRSVRMSDFENALEKSKNRNGKKIDSVPKHMFS
ncbi:MAG: proteasome-activating nucleotidase [Thermoplasmatota archaeon]